MLDGCITYLALQMCNTNIIKKKKKLNGWTAAFSTTKRLVA
jgi:hypothetical protein